MKKRLPEDQISGSLRRANAGLSVALYTETVRELPDHEVALLREGGLNPETESGLDPLTQTDADFAALIQVSLGTSEAAALLGVHVGRVRRMLSAEASLYGFKVNGRWCIPNFQFTETGLVPGIEEVNAAIDRALHPVAVYRWFISPDPELDIEGVVLSPLAWLKAGYGVEAVCRIAAGLCVN